MNRHRLITLAATVFVFAALAGCTAAGTSASNSAGNSSASSTASASTPSASSTSAASASTTSAASASTASAASASTSAPSTLSAASDPAADAPQADALLTEDKWGNYFPTLGDEATSFGQRALVELPVAATACWQGEGGGEPVEFSDPATIRALFNALAAINVADYATEVATDDHTGFGFTFADGTMQYFSFDSMTVQVREGNSWKFHAIQSNADLDAFASIARQHTMALSD